MTSEYLIAVYINADDIGQADEWARGIVFPSEPIEWKVTEAL
jgi:hypothetical protein